ncbi:TPA: hypothetical protein N0F65_008435 [Lagenidium giganteum]|uniref:Uncharacterized protein n=1 Tax=Lagenidium giganteum TaxID=4803 RepID=A0AAV2YRE5_9STRA|nr:TPA: hypothetical protein N0F65_008435 [Lagenidium giganteum]
MSLGVSRESISKLMTELVDSFPMEGEGRSSISDFGKLLFTEGQNGGKVKEHADKNKVEQSSTKLSKYVDGVPRQKQHEVTCVITENGKIALSQSSMRKIMKSKEKAVPKRWTPEEDDRLREAVGRHGERNWKSIAEEVPGRNHTQCLQRWTKVLAPGLVKGHWRPDEDELLKELVAEGRKNWGQVAAKIPGRTSKQCRERWYNHLDPSIVRGEYSADEDRIILEAQARLGNRWSAIAAMLPGRTEDAVKIRWKSLCRVRKGAQGRRIQEKDKMQTKMIGPGGMPMMHGPPFAGPMIKSEELSSFGNMHPAHSMVRPQVPPVPGAGMPHMGGGAMGMTHPMHQGAPPPMQSSMMYNPEMNAYDPMGQYRKPSLPGMTPGGMANMQYGHTMPQQANQEFNIDRRSNVVNLSSNGMPTQSYRPNFQQGASNAYGFGAENTSGTMYDNSYMNTQNQNMQTPVYRSSPSHNMMNQHMMSSSYGYNSLTPSHSMTPTNNGMGHDNGAPQQNMGMSPAAAFAMQQQQSSQHQMGQPQDHQNMSSVNQQQMQMQQQMNGMSRDHYEQQSAEQSEERQQTQHSTSTEKQSTAEKTTPSNSVPFNPAANFAQGLAKSTASGSSSVGLSKPTFAANPVAAFLHQQKERNSQDNSANDVKPPRGVVPVTSSNSISKVTPGFNPAAAFAQRFAAGQKPPMHATSARAAEEAAEREDNESEKSADNSETAKRFKPRTSIDAARASAARRMRTSGSGAALSGRPSLDVFLNDIQDIGRISDLKMDEFQTLEELWRVSDDMNRLSL